MHNILLIISREIAIRVRKKSFLLTTFLVPVLMALLMVVPSLLILWDTGKHYTVGVVDKSGLLLDSLHTSPILTYVKEQDTIADMQGYLQRTGYAGLLVIGDKIAEQPNDVVVYSLRTLAVDASDRVQRDLTKIVRKERIASFEIEGLEEILKKTDVNVDMRAVILNEAGEEKETSSGLSLMIGYLLGGLIYGLVAASGGMVMSGVVEEKNNRIVEVLVSSVRSFDLLMGKILGVASVFLIQILLWIVVTLVLVSAMGSFIDLGSSDQLSQVASQMGGLEMTGTSHGLMAQLKTGGLSTILGPLESVNFLQLIVVFIYFFFGGYFLYASMYAAIGSAVEDASDAQQLVLPVTIPLLLGFFVLFVAGRSPDGTISFWFSMIPFTSPIVMPARVAYGVDTWEILLSGIFLLITFILMTGLASRVYRNGILQYGKKFGWRDILKWLKN
ncbi:MAG: ABC transporter permease [Bacteroides sp.]